MADPHLEEHSTWIKTPTQLLVVVVLSFVVTVLVIVMLVHLVTDRKETGSRNPALTEEAIAKRLQPVGEVVVADPNAPVSMKSGEEVYKTVCAACHANGLLNAPKVGDTSAWGKLVGAGLDRLTQTAINGIGKMPPRGGNPDLNDTEIQRAIVYMANQSGANWKEPEAKPATKPSMAAQAPAEAPASAAAATPAASAAGKGKSVYDSACMACHAAGVAGAPKTGDKAQWAPRLASGMETLYISALKGKGAMPPKGGQMQLSDADVKAAVDWLVAQVK